MATYIFRRLLLMIPTLFGITLLSFVIINLAPGSPVDQKLQQMRMGNESSKSSAMTERGVSQEVIDALNRQYGFDKPLHERYFIWM